MQMYFFFCLLRVLLSAISTDETGICAVKSARGGTVVPEENLALKRPSIHNDLHSSHSSAMPDVNIPVWRECDWHSHQPELF